MEKNDYFNPASTTTEQQIALLEKRIDDLKAEYILFFNHETKAPPEKKRDDLEKAVRKLIYSGARTSRIDMLVQNLAQRFNLYNNLWLKKLNEMESGTASFQKKKTEAPPPPRKEKGERNVYVTLNDEESFDRLINAYRELLPNGGKTDKEREKLIGGMKTQMLTHNLVEASVTFTLKNGKLSIKIKKQ